MCERCWGKAFTAAYGIGSKTQAGEYERIVASCTCTPAQRRGVADSFAEGYTARDKELTQLREMVDMLLAKLEAVPVEEITEARNFLRTIGRTMKAYAVTDAIDRWLATVQK